MKNSQALKKADNICMSNNDWRDKAAHLLRQRDVSNPILQRLRENISGKSGLVITSYDRMHHRHNRS